MIVSNDNAVHYTWGDGCDGWHLLQSASLSVIRERMPPQTAENFHYHVYAQQLFFILEGMAVFILGNNEYTLKAGESIHVAPGTPHAIHNDSAADLHFLVISQPESHGDRQEIPGKRNPER